MYNNIHYIRIRNAWKLTKTILSLFKIFFIILYMLLLKSNESGFNIKSKIQYLLPPN